MKPWRKNSTEYVEEKEERCKQQHMVKKWIMWVKQSLGCQVRVLEGGSGQWETVRDCWNQ